MSTIQNRVYAYRLSLTSSSFALYLSSSFHPCFPFLPPVLMFLWRMKWPCQLFMKSVDQGLLIRFPGWPSTLFKLSRHFSPLICKGQKFTSFFHHQSLCLSLSLFHTFFFSHLFVFLYSLSLSLSLLSFSLFPLSLFLFLSLSPSPLSLSIIYSLCPSLLSPLSPSPLSSSLSLSLSLSLSQFCLFSHFPWEFTPLTIWPVEDSWPRVNVKWSHSFTISIYM